MFNFGVMEMELDLVLNSTNLRFIMKMIGNKVFRNPKTDIKTQLEIPCKQKMNYSKD